MIHSVPGPVSAETLLAEANWALDVYKEAKLKSGDEQIQFVAWSHQQASWAPNGNRDRKVHELLASRPMPKLQWVYEEVFEKILGEKVSEAGPRLAQAATRLEYAKKTGRPILFVMHKKHEWSTPNFNATTRQLMGEFAVIVMPLKEGPALSQLTGQPPFEASGSARPLFVVARSNCEQIASVAGWNEQSLAGALASGWVDALEENPPNVRTLVRAQRLLRKASPAAAQRAKDLTIRVQEEARTAREAKNKTQPKLAAL